MSSYSQLTLGNGMRVVHYHDPHTAMVALNVLYDVGARDESPTLTGMAHLFEHLMFSGSAHVPRFDHAMERAGAVNNAWTSNDFTNFWEIAPAVNVETLFHAESDRMAYLSLTQEALDIQRSVVIEEFRQTSLNRPYGRVGHLLRGLLYREHPYRYPVIGRAIEDLERVTLRDLQEFYDSHYTPGRAVLSITGGIGRDEAFALAEKWFGTLPARPSAPRQNPVEAPITEPRELVYHDPRVPQAMVITAWPMAEFGTPDYFTLDLLTDLLAAGRSSRMFRELVMPGRLFTDADASIMGSEEPGFVMLSGSLLDPSEDSVQEAIRQLEAQVIRIAEQAPGEREMQRIINRRLAQDRMATIDYSEIATRLAMAVMHGRDWDRRYEPYLEVTAERMRRTAERVFRPESRVTLVYLPEKGL